MTRLYRVTVARYVPRGTRLPVGGMLSRWPGVGATLSFGIRGRVGYSVTWERVA